MAQVYILYSKSLNKYYIGYSDDLNERLAQHKEKFFKGSFTSQTSDWNLFLTIECKSLGQAVRIEKHIKEMKSRHYIKNLKRYLEMQTKLLNRFK